MDKNFELGWGSSESSLGWWNSTLNALRRGSAMSGLFRGFRIARQVFHFGPWRVVPQFLIRKLRPIAVQHVGPGSLLAGCDPHIIADEVRRNSVVVAGTLPADFVARMRAVTDTLPANDYQLMHHIDADVHRLAEDPAIKNALRAYFNCEPVLLESTLVVTRPYHNCALDSQNVFHFDYAGWQSLNVFVYLSDVTDASSCHVVARGSHRDVKFGDIVRGSLTDDEAQVRFGAKIQSITGPAGTVFFENTEAFHRRKPGNDRRVLLNLLYASHRSLLSYGRTSRHHIVQRRRQYDQAKAGFEQVAAETMAS